MTLVTYTPKPDLDGATDVLVLGVAPDGDGARLVLGHALSRRPAAALLAAAATVGATGRAGQVHVVPATAGLRAGAVVLVGLGEAPSPATLREAAGAALRAATALPASSSVLVDLPAADADALEAVTEGALLGAYTFTAHKGDRRGGGGTNDRGPAGVAEITIGGGLRVREGRDRVETARVAAESVAWARDLVNTAPNVLYPQSFVDRVRERIAADDAPVELRVIDEKELEELGCGGIIGVGRGSARPPRIAVLSYRPRRSTGHVALVGKGITFDTGGICIKPSADMWQMKSDMGGAAAVAGAVLAAARTAGVGRMVHISSPSVAHAGSSIIGEPAGPADPVRAHQRETGLGLRDRLQPGQPDDPADPAGRGHPAGRRLPGPRHEGARRVHRHGRARLSERLTPDHRGAAAREAPVAGQERTHMIEDALLEAEDKMTKAVEVAKDNFAGIRTVAPTGGEIARDPDAAGYFLDGDTGKPAGTRLTNPAYAKTLSAVATEGADAF